MAVKEETNTVEATPPNNARNKKFQSKVVVRRLPPDMTQSQFIEQVSPLPEYSYLCFEPASLLDGTSASSCAYINFCHLSDLLSFWQQFDGYVFLSQQGDEYTAIVEYAINQRIPRESRSRRTDPKCATIESDEDYVAFVAQLEQQKQQETAAASAECAVWERTLQLIEQQELERKEAEQNGVSTPLVSFVLQRRQDRKSSRRRQDPGEGGRQGGRAAAGRHRREGTGSTSGDPSSPADKKHQRRSDTKHRSNTSSTGRRGRSNRSATKTNSDVKPHSVAVESSSEAVVHSKTGEAQSEESSHSTRHSREQEDADKKHRGGFSRPLEERAEESSVSTDGNRNAASPTVSDSLPRQNQSETGAKVRNKDRPSIAIYRPGMGKYSSKRLQERESGATSVAPDETKTGGDELSRSSDSAASTRRESGSARHLPRGKQHGTMVFRRRRRSHERSAHDK